MRGRPDGALVYATLALVGALVVAASFLPAARGDGARPRLSEREMKRKMNGWARELGVKCSHCHVQEGDEYDYRAPTARRKVAAYCEEHFVGALQLRGRAVSCQDCHQRQPRFLPRPPGEAVAGGDEAERDD